MNQCIPLLINTNAFINIMAKLLCPNSVSCLFVQEVARLYPKFKLWASSQTPLKLLSKDFNGLGPRENRLKLQLQSLRILFESNKLETRKKGTETELKEYNYCSIVKDTCCDRGCLLQATFTITLMVIC